MDSSFHSELTAWSPKYDNTNPGVHYSDTAKTAPIVFALIYMIKTSGKVGNSAPEASVLGSVTSRFGHFSIKMFNPTCLFGNVGGRRAAWWEAGWAVAFHHSFQSRVGFIQTAICCASTAWGRRLNVHRFSVGKMHTWFLSPCG